jgi:hypothetical protein
MPANQTITEGQGATEALEALIRDMAATVSHACQARIDHPTFGYTKTKIRNSYSLMLGAVGVYAVLTGQSVSPIVNPAQISFYEVGTIDRVNRARAYFKDMK